MGWKSVSDQWSGGGRYLDDGGQVAKSLEPYLTRKKKHIYILLCVYVSEMERRDLCCTLNILSE